MRERRIKSIMSSLAERIEPNRPPWGRPARAAYVHVPFCAHRCGYCNFTVVAGRDDLIDAYLDAIERELARLECPRPVDTLFIGGGTPTHLAGPQLERLVELLIHWLPLAPNGEWSVEANPEDFDAVRAKRLADAGVTRVSLGAQSFQTAKLEALERRHRGADVRRAMDLARPLFRSVSLDLIFAAPGEDVARWQSDLTEALSLTPDHLSLYGMTYERGARFWSLRRQGELQEVDEASEAAMYNAAIDRLTDHGYEHYEVSNFARPEHRCRHNEVYWTGQAFYGIGPGAASYVDGVRAVNHRSTTTYIRRVLGGHSPVAECEQLANEDRARETLVFGLRRLEGIHRERFAADTGYDLETLVGDAVDQLVEAGLLEWHAENLRLTRRGLLVSDSIWPTFLRA